MDRIITEPLTEDNFKDFFSLILELARFEKLTPPDEGAKRRLKKDGLSPNPRYHAFLAKVGDEYAGYIIFYPTYSSFLAKPTLYLEDIFVCEKHRMKGIGQSLFDLYLKKARELGCKRAEWCVLNWNKAAIRFYEKNRAKKLDWSFFRIEDP